MGSSYVNLVDRDFMQKLQQKLQEDHTNKMVERIKTRECEEMDRVKNLVLDGKIPLKLAPPEMECHPIMFLESYINSGQKRRQKASKLSNPSTARSFQLKTPSSRITQENENDNENNEKKLEFGFTRSSTLSNEEMPKETTNEFVKVKHDTELMKQLRNAETVDEMYNLAEEIIGYLRQEDSTIKSSDDTISSSN
ncbi:unnamed protein product [Brassicogethes aeneus]|uniref:Uncharacterized protein n=1 Tax=Brassicogethes aeneus TaxID=1431903 RepID=A0A9P0FHK8_BRAAE|nr:unnamed protein product [Brassicogethes aeneus]